MGHFEVIRPDTIHEPPASIVDSGTALPDALIPLIELAAASSEIGMEPRFVALFVRRNLDEVVPM